MNKTASIGELIKYCRHKARLSQEELSRNICAREYIGKIERNECSPTIDMINQLSSKLNVNLYDNYALIIEHHNIETHFRIMELNEAISKKDFCLLNDLIIEYSTYKEFTYGIPFQYLKYSEATVHSQLHKNYSYAVKCASDALYHEKINIFDNSISFDSLSNATILLIQSIAVNLCRLEAYNDGEKYFKFLNDYLKNISQTHTFLVNRNKRFELNVLAHVTYNEYVFLSNSFEHQLKLIDSTLDILRHYNVSNMVTELLLCKSHLFHSFHYYKRAFDTYLQAHYIGLYLYSPAALGKLEREILGAKYTYFSKKLRTR